MAKTLEKLNAWQKFARFFRRLGFVLSLFLVVSAAFLVMLYGLHRENIPEVLLAKDYRPPLKSKVYAEGGELIAEFGNHERIITPKEAMPKLIAQAFIAAEDKNFYGHHGIDLVSVIKAIGQSLSHKRTSLRGASTITQQLAKGLLVKDEGYEKATERTIARKIKEAILARRLEMHLPKDDILWMYLNDVYLGHGAYGVAAAAHNYFRKTLDELNLAQIALLAGLPQAPSRFSLKQNLAAALVRQAYVLDRMKQDKFITQEQYQQALEDNKNIVVYERENTFRKAAPYFSETVRKTLLEKFPLDKLYSEGLAIYTTLNLDHERAMQRVLKNGLIEVDKRQGFLGPIYRPENDEKKARASQLIEDINQKNLLGLSKNYQLAMVEKIDGAANLVHINTGLEDVTIYLAHMNFARPRDPLQDYEKSKLSSVEGIFMPGDVVLVRKVDEYYSLEQEPKVEGAMYSVDVDSGYITALSGGYSFDRSEFNRVFQACRQPGSAFKPVVYSAAIALKNYHPATMVLDTPLTFYDADSESTWRPKNFGSNYKGEVTLHEAVMRSMNIPTLNVMADVGVKNVLDFAKSFGIETKLKSELGTAIGSSCVTPFELGKVFLTIANLGMSIDTIMIKEVRDRDGQRLQFQAAPNDAFIGRSDRLKIVVNDTFKEKKRIMEKEAAFTMHYLLSEVAKHGTAAKTNSLSRHIAGKTGTTNDSFDVWFSGYSKNLMTLVWIGNDTMDIPLGVYEQGARTALPFFTNYMDTVLAGLPNQDWIMPKTMCKASIDEKTGLRSPENYPQSFVAPFKCGEEPDFMENLSRQHLLQAIDI